MQKESEMTFALICSAANVEVSQNDIERVEELVNSILSDIENGETHMVVRFCGSAKKGECAVSYIAKRIKDGKLTNHPYSIRYRGWRHTLGGITLLATDNLMETDLMKLSATSTDHTIFFSFTPSKED